MSLSSFRLAGMAGMGDTIAATIAACKHYFQLSDERSIFMLHRTILARSRLDPGKHHAGSLLELPMAKLKAAARNKLPLTSFGLPGQRKYPMPDASHAANAKARAAQQVQAGKLSKAAQARIDAKANRKIRGK